MPYNTNEYKDNKSPVRRTSYKPRDPYHIYLPNGEHFIYHYYTYAQALGHAKKMCIQKHLDCSQAHVKLCITVIINNKKEVY